jgi:hypothetical protein
MAISVANGPIFQIRFVRQNVERAIIQKLRRFDLILAICKKRHDFLESEGEGDVHH